MTGEGRRTGGLVDVFEGGRGGVETVGGGDDSVASVLATTTDEDCTVVVFAIAVVVGWVEGVGLAVSSSFRARSCLIC